jgi:hypothetical protein
VGFTNSNVPMLACSLARSCMSGERFQLCQLLASPLFAERGALFEVVACGTLAPSAA